mgnify:CR=1 FL=1
MQKILEKFAKITQDLLNDEKDKPVADFVPTDELYETLDLQLTKEGTPETEFEEALRNLVMKTPRTGTNAFFNQLFGGRNEKAILGELLAVMLNNSMYTYKAAGPQIGVEKAILRKVCDIIGWDDKSDGTLAPGGSMTNYMAMVMARDAANEKVRHEGVSQKMTVYTSRESHYSIPKNASFMGIGRDQVRKIATYDDGRMNMDDLRSQIEKDLADGFLPIMVNCTAGTTVLGAFDDIRSAKTICDEHNIWLHVDGAYCGAVLFSKKYKHLIDGIEEVDSFSFNAHKMLGTPLSCSLIMTKDKKFLHDSFSNDASYLYQTDHDEFNLGKMSLQCGRRNDALKFWTLWKSVGTDGLEKIVDQQFILADVARDYIKSNSDYLLYSYDESVSICFNYKGIGAEDICTALYEHSELMVGYGTFREDTFIRLVTINAQNEKEDILNFFKTLEQFVEEHEEIFAAQMN